MRFPVNPNPPDNVSQVLATATRLIILALVIEMIAIPTYLIWRFFT